MTERGSVTRSHLKIETVAMRLRLTEPRSTRCLLSVLIRVHLCSSCQNHCKYRVSCARGRPLSAELSVLRRMQTQFATILQYPAETRPLHFNVSRRFWCMMQTHAHENKIHIVPPQRSLLFPRLRHWPAKKSAHP